MNLGTILLVLLILILVGALPVWPHATSWGHTPVSVVGLLVIIVVVLIVTGKL